MGKWFGGFLILAIVVTAYLVSTRLNDLRSHAELESMVSREAAFLYNNLVLVGIAFSVLWGTLFPIISEAVRGNKITVGPPFFNTVNIPLGLLLAGRQRARLLLPAGARNVPRLPAAGDQADRGQRHALGRREGVGPHPDPLPKGEGDAG